MQIDIKDMEQQAYERDRELWNAILKLKAGDVNAFELIYLHTNHFMFYKAEQILARYYNKDSELRNDLVQDAYIKIFNNISSLQDPSKFYGWINTILVNTIYAYTRAHWREEFDVTNEDGDSMVENVCSDFETPESRVLEQEKIDYIGSALQTLPPLQRYTVELFYFSEMSVDEIAVAMECSEGTVKSRLNYARKKLKGVIEEIEKTNKIKLHSIFALPLLLFLTKENALAHFAVDATSFASVREALRKECVLKPNILQGDKTMNQNNITQNMVSSVSTSIWKTALGKIIIAVSIVLVSAGIITGGYFIFTDTDPASKDVHEEEVSPDIEDENPDFNIRDLFPSKETTSDTEEIPSESAENIPETEEFTVESESSVAEDETNTASLVGEDGYIHISSDAEGTPINFAYKHYEDLPMYTDIRRTYFPVDQEANIDLGYCIKEDGENELLCSVDVSGAYQVKGWNEGLLVNGISYSNFKESGATGLYLDSNVITLSLAEGTDVSTISKSILYLQSETEYSYIMVYCDTTDFETKLAKQNIEIGEYFVQSFYTTVYGDIENRATVITQTLPVPEDVIPVKIVFELNYGNFLEIELQDNNKKPLHELGLSYSEGNLAHYFASVVPNDTYNYLLSQITPEEYDLLEESVSQNFWAYYDLNDNYSYQKTDDYTDLNDPSGISGRYYTSILRTEELVTNHFAPQLKAYTEAETYLDKYSISASIFQPTLLVLLDNQYTFYITDFYYDVYDESKFIRVSGYAVPTGNPYLLEETPLDYGFAETPKEPVIIPDITLEPVKYYNIETGLGNLKTMDGQVNTVMNYLQQEIDGEATSSEQGNAVRSILNSAKELYFIACTDNSSMKSYGDISTVSRLTDFGLDYFSSIMKRYEEKGEFMHYVNVYMEHHTGCVDGRLQNIKDNLALISGAELTKTQKTALILAKDLLDVFYDNREHFETVTTYYTEHASKTYDSGTEYFRELTDYDARAEEINTYWELIPEVPGWVFEW